MEKIIIEFEERVPNRDANRITDLISNILLKNGFKCNMSSYDRNDRTEHLSIYDEDIW